MSSEYRMRQATADDAHIVAHQRAAMFRDYLKIPEAEAAAIEAASQPLLAEMIERGEYLAWLIELDGQAIAGGGVILRRLLPRPGGLNGGEEAYILNVYTEPEYRRRGLARVVMSAIIDWCAAREVAVVSLHASDDGRPLYESLGFAPTSEMNWQGQRAPQ
jgi:GNAT superfamily N-acetyltransferase